MSLLLTIICFIAEKVDSFLKIERKHTPVVMETISPRVLEHRKSHFRLYYQHSARIFSQEPVSSVGWFCENVARRISSHIFTFYRRALKF